MNGVVLGSQYLTLICVYLVLLQEKNNKKKTAFSKKLSKKDFQYFFSIVHYYNDINTEVTGS